MHLQHVLALWLASFQRFKMGPGVGAFDFDKPVIVNKSVRAGCESGYGWVIDESNFSDFRIELIQRVHFARHWLKFSAAYHRGIRKPFLQLPGQPLAN
ncbi:Uncharacterised protein [Enterobacter hormaechei]|nr:Uncharacterised protein [Enterobacter hormaechei]